MEEGPAQLAPVSLLCWQRQPALIADTVSGTATLETSVDRHATTAEQDRQANEGETTVR